MIAVTITSGVAGSASLTTSVTVRPGSMPVVVPLISTAAALAAFTSAKLTEMPALVSSAAVSFAVAGFPAASVTDAVTLSGPSVKPEKSAVVL
ncbi:hypothetical protein MASR2M50_04410 [Thauera sp.]